MIRTALVMLYVVFECRLQIFTAKVKYFIDCNYLFCHGTEDTESENRLIGKSLFLPSPNVQLTSYSQIFSNCFTCSVTFRVFSPATFSRCWTCLWLSLWTTLNIWHVTPPSWALTTWMSLSVCGRSMTQPHGMFQPALPRQMETYSCDKYSNWVWQQLREGESFC